MNQRDAVDAGLGVVGGLARKSAWINLVLCILILCVTSWLIPTALGALLVLTWLAPTLPTGLLFGLATLMGALLLWPLFWLTS